MKYADPDTIRASIIRTLADEHRHVFVGASAGSGKTSTLVALYRALIEKGVSADTIAAITFTENAAHEMKRRIRASLAKGRGMASIARASISTIHSFCLALIREYGCMAGITLPPRVAETNGGTAELLRARVLAELDANTDAAQVLMPLMNLHIASRKASFVDAVVALAQGIIPRFADEERFLASVSAGLDRAAGYGERRRTALDAVDRMHAFHGEGKTLPEYKLLVAPVPAALVPEYRDLAVLSENVFIDAYSSLMNVAEKIRKGTYKRIEKFPEFLNDLRSLAAIADDLALDLAFARYRDAVSAVAELAATALNAYQQMRIERNIISFDDIIATAVRLFDTGTVRDAIRRRYTHIIVDEFQDTNWQQYELIRRLVEGAMPHPVLFVVGDRKQSIYRFRNADVSLFTRTKADIERAGGTSFGLSNNFRSTPAMLAFFNAFFSHVLSGDTIVGYGPDDDFSNAAPSDERAVTFLMCNTRTRDGTEILARERTHLEAHAFARCVADHADGGRSFDGTALLLPSFSDIHEYLAAFAAYGIPYHIMGGQGFYERDEIRHLTVLITYLATFSDALFFPVLKLPFFALIPEDSSTLAACMYAMDISPHTFCSGTAVPKEAGAEAARAVALIREFAAYTTIHGIADTIEFIVERTRYHAYLMTDVEGEIAYANVRKFIEIARVFEKGGGRTLIDLVRYVEHEIEANAKEGYAVIPELSSRALRVYTVHAAKGLEFDTVLLGGLTKKPPVNSEELSFMGRSLAVRVKHPDIGTILISDRDDAEEERQTLSERKRLLYVAATRAKRSLVIAGPAGGYAETVYDTLIADFVRANGGIPLIDESYGVSEDMHGLRPITHDAPHARFFLYGRGIAAARTEGAGAIAERSRIAHEVCRILAGKPHPKAIEVHRTYDTITARAHALHSRDTIDRITLYHDAASDDALSPAEMGDRVHRMLEHYRSDAASTDRLVEEFFPEGTSDALRARTMLNAFIASSVGKNLASGAWTEVGREVPFTAVHRKDGREHWLPGRIDLIARDEKGALIIVDHKTAKQPPSSEAYRFQMRSYCCCVARMYAVPISAVRAILLYLGAAKGPEEETISVTEEDVPAVESMLFG
ncbi:MAG: UvrD-helicase domain-containing protein [Spirochaetota bacterium]